MAIRSILRFGILVVLILAGRPAAAQTGQFDLEKTKSVLSELIEDALRTRGVPSISIALVRGDEIVWTEAFGYVNMRTRTPATPETLYSTGSTFKSVTSTALMQLAEQGKLELDQPVNAYLGDSRVQDRLQSEKPVTFRHILSHWSGLIPGANVEPIWGRKLPKTLDEMVSGLYSIRAPEAQWEYNNYAFGMAGLLVEKISGSEYEEYVLEHILRPLGVETPHPVYPSPEMVELMALPYTPGGSAGSPRPVAQVHYDVYPAGDIYLTAEDMARFLGAHLNGGVFNGVRILSEESVVAMRTPQFGGSYGFGLSVEEDERGHTIISHTGGIPGQSSNMVGDVDARVGVYTMSNSGAPGEIATAALALLRGEEYTPPSPPPVISVDRSVLRSYVGQYRIPNASVQITEDGGRLFAEGLGQGKNELLAETATTFRLAGGGIGIEFRADDAGAVTHMVISAGGQTFEAPRESAAERRPPEP